MKKVKLSSKYGKFGKRQKTPMQWLKWIILGYFVLFIYVIVLSYFTGK